MEGDVILEVTVDEAKDLIRKQGIVTALNRSGALDVRGGSVTLHYDADGLLRKVERHDTLYRT